DYATTHMSDPTSGNVLANDEPEPGLELTVISNTDPEHGTVTIDSNGDFVYEPDTGYVGEDSFTYIAYDGETSTDPITVTITMWNNPPTPEGDTGSTHMGTSVIINIDDLLSNDTDPDNDSITFDSFSYTGSGSVVDNEDGTLTYTPVEGYVGDDAFTYTVTDPQIDGTPQETTVTISMNNNPPTPTEDADSTHMGTAVIINIADLLSNDTDPDSDEVYYDSFSYLGSGSLVDNSDGTLTYTPVAGYVGDDSFTYTVTDPQIDGTPVEATVIISMGNNAPQVNDDTIVTDFTNEINGNVLDNDNDPDNDNLTVVLDGVLPEHGQLVLNPDGTFTYTPDPGYSGGDSFAYLATDGQLDGDSPVTYTGMVWININPFITAAPLPEEVEFVIAGCPALVQWTADELGMDEGALQVWIVNTVASSRGIQPCDACANLKAAATVLQDAGGTYVAALAQVVNEFASSTAPPSEEQMASIASAISNNTEAGTAYALAGEYLDALVAYVGILNSDLDYSVEDSITLATDKYVAPLADENVNLATYVAVRLLESGI
ncbi:Ig-like domain-containing protein, partial [Planctomycetota bacterium]